MRSNVNQVFHNGAVVEETTVLWTERDYLEAIAFANDTDKEDLLNELAFLQGIPAMKARIDQVADAKRLEFLGDVSRAFEYQAAEAGARSYADAGFTGMVPEVVSSWAEAAGLTPQAAAENIMQEAGKYNGAMLFIRRLRLEGKQGLTEDKTSAQLNSLFFGTVYTIQGIGG